MRVSKNLAVVTFVLAALAAGPGAAEPTSRELREKAAAEKKVQIAALERTVQPVLASPGKLVVEDLRPADAKRNRLLSGWMFDCHSAIWNLGDNRVAPDRIARLEEALLVSLGEGIAGQKLTVRRYTISLNARAAVSATTFEGTGGIVPSLMKQGVDYQENAPPASIRAQCKREEMQAGWFEARDITNNYSPIIIEMDFSLGDRVYLVRSAYSAEVEPWDVFEPRKSTPIIAAIVQHAMAKAHVAVADEVARPE
ncbi:hypothetical protein [Phenylobacterium sp.]|uniref:hypothetical protein n=1 Tax=Phenylobacterium sp. TaxID=1871053 RepID=UPI002734B0B6|nr:hypothetical protein [Phenylobacterium sp.]MDP3855872.1 hypothetical protein [Phenylobacterium sp.]